MKKYYDGDFEISGAGNSVQNIKTTFRFYSVDGDFFGAYKIGSLSSGEPVLMFNMDFLCQVIDGEENKSDLFKDTLLQTLTHEFCHAMQEWLDKEYDEVEVERILGAIKKEWNSIDNSPEDQQEWADRQIFKISDFLNWMNNSAAQNLDEFKQEIDNLFRPVKMWMDAFERSKGDKK